MKEEVADGGDGIEVELRAEVVENVVGGGSVLTVLTQRRDRGPVGARADEDLEDVLGVDFSVLAERQGERAGERVDEEVKQLLLVNFAVCLLFRGHTVSKQTSRLTGFVRY